MSKILVTSALPYANGDIHLGHLVEYLQTDFWVRYKKMFGIECLYICSDDTHGTPIMLRAKNENITVEQLLENSYSSHIKDFSDLEIHFDHYSSTNSTHNKKLCEKTYYQMKPYLIQKEVEQAYSEHDKMFLPDRYVKGICPFCKTPDQYGDFCENCSKTYSPMEMINPKSTISNTKVVPKKTKHLFLDIEKFRPFLQEWTQKHTSPEIYKKLQEWLQSNLKPWNISRNHPYFGFQIPENPDLYFYVWVDAPLGYIAATQEWCENNNRSYLEYWNSSDTQIYHFIGKDIVYFHALFWPCMLKILELSLPEKLFVHGFLKINDEKMSKSKGSFLKARTYLNHLDAAYLRYYYASKISNSIDDINLNLDDFKNRVNSELIGKIINLGSRCCKILEKNYDNQISEFGESELSIWEKVYSYKSNILNFYEERKFSMVTISLKEIADIGNQMIDSTKPWELIKNQAQSDIQKAQQILTLGVNIFRFICIFLKPILPKLIPKIEKILQEKFSNWKALDTIIKNIKIQSFEKILVRIQDKDIEKILQEQSSK